MNARRRRRGRRGAHWARDTARFYRVLLWLYPPSLRREYGDDMLQIFRDTLRHEVARAGPPGALRAWGDALTDLAASLPREWPRELGRLRPWRRAQTSRRVITRRVNGVVVGHTVIGQIRKQGRRMNNDKFEKFTERARKVLRLSQEEAQRFNHNYIGTEHLLLGLVRERDGVAAKVLDSLDVELDKVRNAVEFIIGRGDHIVLGEVGLTPRAKKVIELAIDEARRLNHHYIGTEHILLGLVREGEGIAAGVLESLGVNLEKVRAQTLAVLNASGPGASQRSASGPGASQRSASAHARPRPDLGRFSDRARLIIAQAITEARERDQRAVGTGHALLALLDEQNGIAVGTLEKAGLDRERLRHALEQSLGPRTHSGEPPAKGPVDLDEHALRMIALAADEASQMNHRFVDPEHLLLGIIREGDGLGAQMLAEQSADSILMRELIRQRPPDLSALTRRPALGRITLLCHDIDATARFYMRHFDAQASHRAQGPAGAAEWELRLPGGGSPLILRPGPAETRPLAGDASFTLDIWVADVDLQWRTMKDSGMSDLPAVTDGPDGRSFTVPDPDGRQLHIYTRATPPGSVMMSSAQ